MFRICRKTVFPRWHTKRQKPVEKNQSVFCPKGFVLRTSADGKSYGGSNQRNEKQHADRQNKRFWDDPQFHFNFLNSTFFETAGWLGTVALCFNYHLKHINNVLDWDRFESSCLFSNIVLALPKRSPSNSMYLSQDPALVSLSSNQQKLEKDKVSSETTNLEDIRKLTEQYVAAVENVYGVLNTSKNDKKAFHSFQIASRLGSSQAFYNLGLCYELGKGTKINLNMAAFWYRKAAMKGHGLASFNLAVFLFKGIGGLPVDTKLAKELLAQAAEKGVPEAQVYFGIDCLENEKWVEAVEIFSSLAKRNVHYGQYYLGLCYENGFGVKRNEEISLDLYSKSAAQGNEKASQKLKDYQSKKENGIKEPLKSSAILKSPSLHISLSNPELSAVVKKSNQDETKISILSQLDLTTPFPAVRNNYRYNNNFNIKDKISTEYTSTFLPFRHISLALEIKT